MKTYPTHELARLLPPMTDEDYQRLVQDLKENGLLEPITLYEGEVLDGIHRQRACQDTSTKPRYVTYDGDDPAVFVFSRNLARRHLSVGQLAMVGAELMPRFRAKMGRPESRQNSVDLSGPTAKRVGDVLGISHYSVNNAVKVKQNRPDLAKEVKAGKRTLNSAYEETIGRRNGGHRRAKNWNGKTNPMRGRELKQAKPGVYAELLRLSLEMNRVCNVIEAYKPDEFELDLATIDLISDFHDDLVTLANWTDRALVATQGWLSSVDVRNKIAALREKTVANGATPEEAESAQRVADKLERKLEAVLPA